MSLKSSVDQSLAAIFFAMDGTEVVLMLPNLAGQVCGYADIKGAMRATRHIIDVAAFLQLMLHKKCRRPSEGWGLSRISA